MVRSNTTGTTWERSSIKHSRANDLGQLRMGGRGITVWKSFEGASLSLCLCMSVSLMEEMDKKQLL